MRVGVCVCVCEDFRRREREPWRLPLLGLLLRDSMSFSVKGSLWQRLPDLHPGNFLDRFNVLILVLK